MEGRNSCVAAAILLCIISASLLTHALFIFPVISIFAVPPSPVPQTYHFVPLPPIPVQNLTRASFRIPVIPPATVAIIQVINYLLALPQPLLPQLLNNKIIKAVEDMANQPFPDNVSSVRIVTDNMVLTMEEVQEQGFAGVLFASIQPSTSVKQSPKLHSHTAFHANNGSQIGNKAFKRIHGALNVSLKSLDLDSVDEYMYVPENISQTTANFKPNNKCVNATGPASNKTTLQFVIYENDQLFRTDGDTVSVSHHEDTSNNLTITSWKVISRVVSATLGGHCVWGLDDPVVINLKHHINFQEEGSKLCVYWDFDGKDGLGSWSKEGCSVYYSTTDHTVCVCNHLTNYAVIIDIWDQLGMGELSAAHSLALEVVSYIGCSMSLIGLVTTMGLLISIRRMRDAKTTPTRMMLCMSLIISMTFYLTGMGQTSDRNACAAFACCIHYFTLVSLMWMGMEGVYLYRNIVLVAMSPSRHMFRNCCLIAWGIPAIIVGCVVIFKFDVYGNDERCWISNSTIFFATFFAPAILIVLINLVVFVMVMWVLANRHFDARRYTVGSKQREISRGRREILGIISITALLGLTWLFGGFSVGEGVRMTSLYLFTIFNSAQGFFIFVFYGALSFVTTRGKTSLASPSPFTNTTGKKCRELAVPTKTLNRKLLRLQLSRSQSDKRNTVGETWITSCSDVRLDFGRANNAFDGDIACNDVKGSKITLDTGSRTDETTLVGFVLSAGILHTGNQRSSLDEREDCRYTVWVESGNRLREEFVVGTGIIFCGKQSSIDFLQPIP
ncbi:adhesion G protein-coupled receptor L1-like [Asterias amurensis]|uniref:adhesion G protein-coupled receptor L1-like n=1 Tax=Asterias amurensis TaxID=7602 RepID=UPI003AB55D9B